MSTVSPSQRKLNHSFSLSFGGQTLIQSNVTKFLEVYLDEHLAWKYHINFVCKQIAKSISILSRTRFYLSCMTKLALFYTLIYPCIAYCNSMSRGRGGGGVALGYFLGGVCATRDSKEAPRSRNNFPSNWYPVVEMGQFFVPRSRIRPKTDTPF